MAEPGSDLSNTIITLTSPDWDSVLSVSSLTDPNLPDLWIYNFDDQVWREDALCVGKSEQFFVDRGESTRYAKTLCAKCPVKYDCLEYAVTNGERYGIWGGLADRDRRRIRVAMGRGWGFLEAAKEVERTKKG